MATRSHFKEKLLKNKCLMLLLEEDEAEFSSGHFEDGLHKKMLGAIKYQKKIPEEFFSEVSEKTVSKIVKMKEDDIRKHRMQFAFPNELKKTKRWSVGRPFSLQQSTVFLQTTNIEDIAYLDLHESAFNCAKFYGRINKDPECDMEERIRDNHNLDYRITMPFSLKAKQDNLFVVYQNDVLDVMKKEFINYELRALLKQWDAKRFTKFLNFYLSRRKDRESYAICLLMIGILKHNCSDSQLIANSIGRMCLHFKAKNFASILPHYFIKFMMKHVKIASNYSPTFGKHLGWLLRETLVEMKFMMGDVKSLQVLLSYNCFTYFCINNRAQKRSLPISDFGPQHAARSEDYNSIKYHRYLTNFLVRLLERTHIKKEYLAECIRMIWRYISTPIIPIEQMQTLLYFRSHFLNRDEILRLLDIFPQEFASSVFEPRSLLHLSRCTIVRTFRTPDAIPSLFLPQKLKRYLELNSIETIILPTSIGT